MDDDREILHSIRVNPIRYALICAISIRSRPLPLAA
jgi:hypothetical protein